MTKERPFATGRRDVLIGAAAATMASAAPRRARAAGHHAVGLGAFAVTVLSDGHLVVPAAQQAVGADPAELKAALRAAGQSGERIEPSANVTLLRRGSDVVLIDTGAGPHFMPTAGKLADSLAAAGIGARTITHVVFTHAHPDHLWGTLDDFDQSPSYPNAVHVIAAAEWSFWMAEDTASRLPESRRNFAAGAQRNLRQIGERLRTVRPGEEIVAGVRALDTAGHTAGHMAVEIAAGAEGLIVTGDALLHPSISFAHPGWRPAADHHDPAQAVATRRRLLDRLAADRSRIIGYHLPFPGLGRVERRGQAYAFVAG